MLTEAQRVAKNERQRKRYAENPEVRERTNKAARKWDAAHPEAVRQRMRKYVAAHSEQHRTRSRLAKRKQLGIPEPTRPMPDACECCGQAPGKRGLVADHDHVTGIFRGWLHNSCNLSIGNLGDDIAGIKRALNYLIRAKETA